MYYEVAVTTLSDGPHTCVAGQGSLCPVFWDEASPELAARRVSARHVAALTRFILHGVYAACASSNSAFAGAAVQEELLGCIRTHIEGEPNAMQSHCLTAVVQGRDLMCIDRGGSNVGDSSCIVSCVLPALRRLDFEQLSCQCLVLTPSQEIAKAVRKLVFQLAACLNILCQEHHFFAGTPACVVEMIQERTLRVDGLRIIILDELDELVMRGLDSAICDVRACTPRVQACSFSRTLSPEVLALTSTFMHDEVRIIMRNSELTLRTVRQYYVAVERSDWKLDTLCDIVETLGNTRFLAICNTRSRALAFDEQMRTRDFRSLCIHADMGTDERQMIIRNFHSGAAEVILSDHLVAHEVNQQQLSAVINVDFPFDPEDFLHRSGRKPRFQRGVAIHFITNQEVAAMREVERYFAVQIEEMPMDIADHL